MAAEEIGPTDTYTTNNLNQYTSRNSSQAAYDPNGNMTNGVDGSVCTYDAQNRLLSATKSGTTEVFKYDGLNRQISRTTAANPVTYNVYDGWTLICEYASGSMTPSTAYLSGAGGLVKNLTTNRFYYQDASGSTSHYTDNTGHLLEWYRYDLQGTPIFSGGGNSSAFGVRHLFTGQQWYSEIGLYDLRNRFYSPDIGRFLQADPIGFNGDPSNLYRYCGNNPLKWYDPKGTQYTAPFPPAGPQGFLSPNQAYGNSGMPNGVYAAGTLNSRFEVNTTHSLELDNVINGWTAYLVVANIGIGAFLAPEAGPVVAGGYKSLDAAASRLAAAAFVAATTFTYSEDVQQVVEQLPEQLAKLAEIFQDLAAAYENLGLPTNVDQSNATSTAQEPFANVQVALSPFGPGGTIGGSGAFGAGGLGFGGGGPPSGIWGDSSGSRGVGPYVPPGNVYVGDEAKGGNPNFPEKKTK